MTDKTNLTFAQNVDFFHVLIENNEERRICVGIAILATIFGPPLLLCIIWFERFGSDNKRTLLNRLVAMNCWTGIEVLLLSNIPEIVRFTYGPLPELFCSIRVIFATAFGWMFILYIDVILIVRYIFIFWLKNPSAFCDDFWCYFIGIWIHGFSLISLFVWHLLAKFQTMGYYICTGQNIAKNRQNFPKAYGVLEIISIILHVIIYLKIRFYKKKQQNVVSSNKKSLFTYFFNILGIAFFCSVIFTMKKVETSSVEQLITFPNYILFYFLHLVSTSIFIFIVIVSFFKNSNLRRAIILEICSYF